MDQTRRNSRRYPRIAPAICATLVPGAQRVSIGMVGRFAMSKLPIYDDGRWDEKYGRPSIGISKIDNSSGPND